MSTRDDDRRDDTPRDRAADERHFDELEAVRRFPSEDEWLDLPMPADLPADDADHAGFADRVLQARNDERQLDERLLELDRALPNELLQQFTAPEVSATFVDDTTRRVQQDRRQRWAETLSRYVAPEPSPEFVNRTIAALEHDAPRQPATATTARSRGNLTMWGLLSAAAAALLWLALADDTRKPLEVRLADRAPTAVSYAEATSPMAAILSGVADQEEPHAVFDEPADGLWLFGEGGEVR